MASKEKMATKQDGAKIKDGKIIHEVNYFFISDEYKNLVGTIFKVESMDGDLHLRNFNNQKLFRQKLLINI